MSWSACLVIRVIQDLNFFFFFTKTVSLPDGKYILPTKVCKINDSGVKTFNLSVITFIYVSSLCNGSVQHRAVEEEVSSPAVAPSSHRQLTGRQSESRKSWERVWRSRGGSPALWTVNSLKIWVNKLLFSSKTNYCVLRIHSDSNFVGTPLPMN